VDCAKEAGATIAIFGHWHIPLHYEKDGVTVVNPGAIASGNFFSRQLCQSVALLFLFHNGDHEVVHIDIAAPNERLRPICQWPASFKEALGRFSESIFAPDVEELLQHIRLELSEELRRALIPMLLPLIQRCWRQEVALITLPMLHEFIATDQTLTTPLRAELDRLLVSL